MRRILLAAALLGAALAAVPAPAAVRLITSINMYGSAFNPDNSGFSIFPCSEYTDETVGGPTTTNVYCSVYVTDGVNSANANGPLTMTLDPIVLTGSITGTVGGITVDIDFLASEVTTTPPYASAELVPTPPQKANVQAAFARNGRINGTVSSPSTPIGPITGTNGGANASRFHMVMVSA